MRQPLGVLQDNAWDRRVMQMHADMVHRLEAYPRVLAAGRRAAAGVQHGLDRLVPVDRVQATGVALGLMTLTDSAATYVWLRAGIAREGNPFVASLIDWAGTGWGLAARAVWSLSLIMLLTLLARTRDEARFGMVVVAIPLVIVAGLHMLGVVLMVTGAGT